MDVIHPPNLEQSGSGEVVYEHFGKVADMVVFIFINN